jgi:hypothetical protein
MNSQVKLAELGVQAAALRRQADQLQVEQNKIDKFASGDADEKHFLLGFQISVLHERARQLLLSH